MSTIPTLTTGEKIDLLVDLANSIADDLLDTPSVLTAMSRVELHELEEVLWTTRHVRPTIHRHRAWHLVTREIGGRIAAYA